MHSRDHRIGRKDWDGLPLQNGYHFYAGNKEISLDSPVSPVQLPLITGVEEEPSDSEDHGWDRSARTPTVALQQDRLSKENIPQATAPKHFVSPASFYGQLPKKEPSGPLLALWNVETTLANLVFRHDPDAEGAVVMKAPTIEQAEKINKKYHDPSVIFVRPDTSIPEGCLSFQLSLIPSLQNI